MVLEVLAAGAVLGKAVGELVDAVKALIKKGSSFKSTLKRIQSKLETITPHLDDITRLDQILNESGVGINDLVALVREGKELVNKCSKLDRLNFLKVPKYANLLFLFEGNLSWYFSTVLTLDQSKYARETFSVVKEVHRKFDQFIPEILREIKNSRERRDYNDLETEDDKISSYQVLKQICFEIIKDEAEGSSSWERRDDQAYEIKTIMKSMEDNAQAEAKDWVMKPMRNRPVFPEVKAKAIGAIIVSTSSCPVFGIEAYSDEPVMTREERARAALSTMNADNKKEIVLNYLDSQTIPEFGHVISTKCIVYNATGDTVQRVDTHDWFGSAGSVYYPSQIENGQWSGFLHVNKLSKLAGSVGAVVYRGENQKDEPCDWMLSWSNPLISLFQLQQNCVYTEIREGGHYEKHYWGILESKLNRSGKTHRDNWNGCSSSMTTGTGTTVVVEAIMTLENA